MAKTPSIRNNYIYNVLYQGLAVIVPLITTPYVSRVLQADGIGEYSYALSIVSYFSMVAALGVATYGQLETAKLRDNPQERSTFFWEIFIARFVTTIVSAIIYILLGTVLQSNTMIYKIMLINLVSGAMDISWFFQGLEQFKLTVLRNGLVRIICTILIFVFVRNKSDLILYVFILQGSTLVGNILLWPYLTKYLHRIKFSNIKFYRHWRNSLVYFIPMVATSVYTVLDKSMIGFITKSSYENGYYEQAHKIEQVLIVVLTSLGSVTLPRLAYLWKQGDRKSVEHMMKWTTNFILFLSFPMMFGVFAISNKLIPLFLGPGFEPCIQLLCVFSVLLVVVGLDNTIGKQCLVATGRQAKFNRGVIVGAIVNFLANLFLINMLGALGAAIGSVLAECSILLILIYYSRDVLSLTGIVKGVARYGGAAALMGVITWGIGLLLKTTVACLLLQTLVGVLTYGIILTIIKDPFLIFVLKQAKKIIAK